jgi:predicted membrane protein
MEDRASFRITPRLVFGALVLLFGSLLLLDRMGMIDARDYLQYWPAGLIAVGVVKLMQPGGRAGGFILAGLGTWLLLSNLGYVDFDARIIFPAILVLIGLRLVMGEAFRRSRRVDRPGSASDEVDAVAVLGGIRRTSSSASFRGGSATAMLGSCEIDLRPASIPAGGEAVIDTFAVWGGIEILVPETWDVVVQGMPILGSYEDQTRPPLGSNPPRLIIKGTVVMGGVEVRNWRKGGELESRYLRRDEPSLRRDEAGLGRDESSLHRSEG